MEQIGYSIVSNTGTEFSHWGETPGELPAIPNFINWPSGNRTYCPTVGLTDHGAKFVTRVLNQSSGNTSSESVSYDGTKVIVTRVLGTNLFSYAANTRATIINSGTVVTVANTDIPVWTDTNSQTALVGLVVGTTLNPSLTTTWKGRDGNFYPLDANGIVTVALGVMTFIETAFGVEAFADIEIRTGAINHTSEIDALPWPSTGL